MNFVGQSAASMLPGMGLLAQPALAGSRNGSADPASLQPMVARYAGTDGVRPRDFAPIDGNGGLFGGPTNSGSGSSGAQGGFFGVINGLIDKITSILNQYSGEANSEGTGTQTVSDGTFASTGDPHLSETASVLDGSGKASSVNQHFDSMSGHANLLSSQDFNGGYRLSAAVTAPNANGVTLNQSSTVHMNNDLDNITLRNDGSFSITSNGNSVSLGANQSVTLEGGEKVTQNSDGSLTVAAQNAYGGSISTTLAAKGGGVDASATVHAATVGGDIAGGTANPAVSTTTPFTGSADPSDPSLQNTVSGFA